MKKYLIILIAGLVVTVTGCSTVKDETVGISAQGLSTFQRTVTGGGVMTASAGTTLTEKNILSNGQLDVTLSGATATTTLPATSTMTRLIPRVGDEIDFTIRNLSTTVGSSTIIAPGTGMTIKTASGTTSTLNGGKNARLILKRELSRDVTVYMSQ